MTEPESIDAIIKVLEPYDSMDRKAILSHVSGWVSRGIQREQEKKQREAQEKQDAILREKDAKNK